MLTSSIAQALVNYCILRITNASDDPTYLAGITDITETLKVLVGWNNFIPGSAADIMKAFFRLNQNGNYAKQTPGSRATILQVIEALYSKYESALKRDMGASTLVSGLMGLLEFEKSPICLKLAFVLEAMLSRDWGLDNASLQLIWESFERFYPLSLKGRKADLWIPTSEELRSLLLQCIIANDAFAAKAFSLCLEKIDTGDLTADIRACFNHSLQAQWLANFY